MMNTPQPKDPSSPLQPPLVEPRPNSNVIYVAAALGMMLMGVLSIVIITLARPEADNTNLYVTIIGFLTTTLASVLAFIKTQENSAAIKTTAHTLQDVHLSINSRFDTFATQIKETAFDAGVKEAEKQRTILDATETLRLAAAETARITAIEVARIIGESAARNAPSPALTPKDTAATLESALTDAVKNMDVTSENVNVEHKPEKA